MNAKMKVIRNWACPFRVSAANQMQSACSRNRTRIVAVKNNDQFCSAMLLIKHKSTYLYLKKHLVKLKYILSQKYII